MTHFLFKIPDAGMEEYLEHVRNRKVFRAVVLLVLVLAMIGNLMRCGIQSRIRCLLFFRFLVFCVIVDDPNSKGES